MTHQKRRRRVAEQVCVLYYEQLRLTLKGYLLNRKKTSKTLSEVDVQTRKFFVRAAALCIDAGADPREFVAAQFAVWRDASAHHNKLILPGPRHMSTDAAAIRYLQYKARQEERELDTYEDDEEDERDDADKHYVEDRLLRNLAKAHRKGEADILAEMPERFTRQYLDYKGVWEVVEWTWKERRQ